MKNKKKELPELNKPEYDVLRVLWKNGKQSVREVHKYMAESHNWALTTTRTVMERMVNKGLLQKENFHGIFIFKPMISRPYGLAKMIKFFADRVLETDVNSVVAMFSNESGLSKEEINELKKLLDEE